MFLCAPVIAEIEFGAQLSLLRTGSEKHLRILELTISKAYLDPRPTSGEFSQ
jgi:hypothetical protein